MKKEIKIEYEPAKYRYRRFHLNEDTGEIFQMEHEVTYNRATADTSKLDKKARIFMGIFLASLILYAIPGGMIEKYRLLGGLLLGAVGIINFGSFILGLYFAAEQKEIERKIEIENFYALRSLRYSDDGWETLEEAREARREKLIQKQYQEVMLKHTYTLKAKEKEILHESNG